jgi:hypothetical protein
MLSLISEVIWERNSFVRNFTWRINIFNIVNAKTFQAFTDVLN